MKALFDNHSKVASRKVTRMYSTSFYAGVKALDYAIRDDIHAIYGFVRFADEIVDTFHDFDKKVLLEEFTRDTKLAIERGISCLLYTSPSPRDRTRSRMPSSA